MKTLLAGLLLALLTCTSARAQDWPRNPATGKVEFRGTLPWPARVKTEAQRKALVRRWYLKRLTDESAARVDASVRESVSPTLVTYANLPTAAVIGNASPPNPGILAYTVALRTLSNGLSYSLTAFHFSHGASTDPEPDPELEQVLTADPSADRPALAALRKRLAAAVAGW